MSSLSPCSNCQRHIRTRETRCPFCATATTSQWRTSLTLALAVTAGLSTAACYGGPPRSESVRFVESGPSATEVPDAARSDSGK